MRKNIYFFCLISVILKEKTWGRIGYYYLTFFFKPNIYSVYQGSLSRKPSPRPFASTENFLFNSSPAEKDTLLHTIQSEIRHIDEVFIFVFLCVVFCLNILKFEGTCFSFLQCIYIYIYI